MSARTSRAFGRALADFTPLKPAEKILREACRTGTVAEIATTRPEAASDDNTVRAGFLRFLLLGGDANTPVHELGVRLMGAWVEGELDLENTTTVSAIACLSCTFTEPLILRRSTLPGGVFLHGSAVPGIEGDGLTTTGGVFLRGGFKATGEVRLLGAQIGGILGCSQGQFDGQGGNALSADRAVIQGSVFLHEGFKATGEVRLLGAQIGGDLACSQGQFDGQGGNALSADGAVIKGNVFLREGFKATGTVWLLGAQIGGILGCSQGQFDGQGGDALCADGMRVTGGFFFRDLTSPVNKVSLAAASVGVLVDDATSWGSDLVLDGFTYGSMGGGAPSNATARLAWLDKQRPAMSGLSGTGADFRPQPWKQLQKVLREMGHVEDARQVAIAFEDRLRKADLIGKSSAELPRWLRWANKPWRRFYRLLLRCFHWWFWALTGYGYRPLRLLAWLFCVWLGCAALYWYAALPPHNVFAPSDPLVFQHMGYVAYVPNSETATQTRPAGTKPVPAKGTDKLQVFGHAGYAVCVPDSEAAKAEQAKPEDAKPAPVKGAGNWYLCEKLPEEYTGFSPLAYSLDVILPLVDLQQEKDWAPRIHTPDPVWWKELFTPSWKHAMRLLLWFETLFGWLASLLLVAIVSGLTKRRED